ncbi:MAG TPA: hypothetical protein VFJ89_10440 [Nocardioides sp.]|jgi:hypothetical protein|nr:hypothetical protein [Nocardioides sp.]
MRRPTAPRVATRTLAVALGALVGAVLLSGSDEPVTAHPFPPWQEIAPPPLPARADALGVRVGPRVLVLGGVRPDGARARDGAAYDLRTGLWRRLHAPAAFTSRDDAVAAGGVVVIRHRRAAGPATWWTYDASSAGWTRMRHLPAHLTTPSAFGSEVYALSGRHVIVYSVQLGRWTALPADRLRPGLAGRSVTATAHGTLVTGRLRARRFVDRWDGLAWHRSRLHDRPTGLRAVLPPGAPRRGGTSVAVGGRRLVVAAGQAWIFTP